jgi:hypothetical protein
MVGGINGASSSYTDQVAYKRADAVSVNTNEKSVAEATTDAGVVYAKSEPSEKQATYSVNKMSKADREALVDSLKKDQEEEVEEEVSVEDLMAQKQEEEEPLEDIGFNEKSEARLLIEKFVDEEPEAVANLLRNWLNDDWS